MADDHIGDSAIVDLFRLLLKLPPIVTAATLGSLTILSIEACLRYHTNQCTHTILRLLSVLSPDFPVESVPKLMRVASPHSRITLDCLLEALATSLRKQPVTTVFDFYEKVIIILQIIMISPDNAIAENKIYCQRKLCSPDSHTIYRKNASSARQKSLALSPGVFSFNFALNLKNL